MSTFDESRWKENDFSREYREKADSFIPQRQALIATLLSFYRHFMLTEDKQLNLLDLGCGDGIITEAVLRLDPTARVTLLDGSPDMIAAAKERLKDFSPNTSYVAITFQEMLDRDTLKTEKFDFIFSSLAIHHISEEEKALLYRLIFDHLTPGGALVNIDTVLSPTEALEKWYLANWREWLDKEGPSEPESELFTVPERYKENPGNTPSTLKSQLEMLEAAGFSDVDCFYKTGIFTVLGARRPGKT